MQQYLVLTVTCSPGRGPLLRILNEPDRSGLWEEYFDGDRAAAATYRRELDVMLAEAAWGAR